MKYLEEIDYKRTEFGDLYDELPLWSAPFGLLLLEHVEMRPGITILDVGAGTGFLSIELLRHYFIRLGFVPGWKSIAPEGSLEQTFAALEHRLNAVAATRGGLSLTIPAAYIRASKPAAQTMGP